MHSRDPPKMTTLSLQLHFNRPHLHAPTPGAPPQRSIMKRMLILALIATLSFGLAQKQLEVWVLDGVSEGPHFANLEEAFNASQDDIQVDIVPLPSINDALQSGFLGGELGDVIMLDGPNMANYVWSGQLAPIDEYITDDMRADLLPAIIDQGTYGPDGKLYSISPYDSSVLLWGNRSYLEEAGVRIPTSVEDAWTFDEFEEALYALNDIDGVTWPLDMKLNYDGEWFSYGFSPFIQACGADLIDRETWVASGTLDSPEAVQAMERLQSWMLDDLIVPASAGDNRFFGDKTAALTWVGNWMWGAHSEGLGEDLVLIPAPKFCSEQAVSPNGGWSYAIPQATDDKDAAGTFIQFAMSSEMVADYADVTGYVPARASAVELSEVYGPGGQGELMAEQSATIALVRPVHPAYPVISQAFGQAVINILDGGDVQGELSNAAGRIDDDIADNAGYPPFNN